MACFAMVVKLAQLTPLKMPDGMLSVGFNGLSG